MEKLGVAYLKNTLYQHKSGGSGENKERQSKSLSRLRFEPRISRTQDRGVIANTNFVPLDAV
jgi:hypothetical protein